ncbi:aminotransferase class V-fold PLP-dependent enzyme [Dasania sp. GY-MA-18]|uniref:Aminotransferase class V-fold PLP-dependent enzyme n=1 Tax=Dasania phycosphaerae TaxID=2950436 RepID=A0A9J6RQ64_9GAMM|nr:MULTISPECIES: aminotransferase class V-fold PLP-dependent enzyme [Dasania]MCR8923739.1 aminotransferase class V-fold PLP-dependent enzyme [Dasania sp. GY-MA-18]MCZ0866173.1 aminotransferase class V-fold PLP-dependent enzyme [Dasania phycosphaerae]MCZ0869897.1 aminotransferase class V-fold PLP-dependent enzyme [Dasania phycosphaerae]
MTYTSQSVDPGGMQEFSVVFTDRSLNHMSKKFQAVMRDISSTLKKVYNAKGVALIPGGGTYGMEAVARQFANNEKCLVVRNGWFSFRWTQILEMGNIPSATTVMKARPIEAGPQAAFAPCPIEEVVAAIKAEKPAVVFAPHVETSSGIMLPDDYIQQMAAATHEVGGLMVLDCIASGCIWVDMEANGVDLLISAPQKGWSASPCSGLVMMSDRALDKIENTTSSSFACDLKKWKEIMNAYENGGHAYHATMPTDSLVRFHEIMQETEQLGFDKVKQQQFALADSVCTVLQSKGFKSVAAAGFQAPGVIVSYTDDSLIQNGKKFADIGVQIAAGVPLQCDEPADYSTFRIGLFGLDKLNDIDGTTARLEQALNQVL